MIQITDLVKLKLCPYRFYLEKMKKKKIPTNQEIYLGKVYHKIAEEITKRESHILEEVTAGMSQNLFDILYAEYCRVIRNVILRRKKKLVSLDIEYGQLMKELREYYKAMAMKRVSAMKKVLEEEEIEIFIDSVEYRIEDGELGLVGKVDRIETHEGVIVPVEIKTVQKKRPTVSEMLQLAGYALLLERERNTSVCKGIIEYPSKRFLVDIPDKLKQNILNLRDYALEILQGEIPEKIRTDRCDRCHLYDECWRLE